MSIFNLRKGDKCSLFFNAHHIGCKSIFFSDLNEIFQKFCVGLTG